MPKYPDGDSLDAIQQERNLRDRILGTQRDPAQAFSALVGDLSAVAPELAERFFAGLDPTDTAGVQSALLSLVDAFDVGGDAFIEQMHDLTRSDLLNWVDQATGSLEDMRDTVDATTNAIRNVPQWFRLQSAVLQAAAPDPFEPVIPPPLPPRHPVDPGPFGGPQPGRPITEPGPTTVTIGPITVVQRPSEDGEAVARRTAEMVKREFERDNLARTGSRHGAFTL